MVSVFSNFEKQIGKLIANRQHLRDYLHRPDYRNTHNCLCSTQQADSLILTATCRTHTSTNRQAVAVSCGYGTCFAVRSCNELYHFSEIGHIHLGIEA